MKVHVDELPSCCEDCVCHNGVSGRCKLIHRTTFDIPPRDCPLKSIADYAKQVRKEVIEEIKSKMSYWEDCLTKKPTQYVIDVELLNEIQGENNDTNRC